MCHLTDVFSGEVLLDFFVGVFVAALRSGGQRFPVIVIPQLCSFLEGDAELLLDLIGADLRPHLVLGLGSESDALAVDVQNLFKQPVRASVKVLVLLLGTAEITELRFVGNLLPAFDTFHNLLLSVGET